MNLRRLLPAALLALVAATGGCSDDDERTDGATGETETAPTPGGSSLDLRAVQSDAESITPQLESALRGSPYPETVAEAEAALADAGLTLTPGNSVGGYRYDPAAEEFALCIENVEGAWAVYDTAPMSTRESGSDGLCPDLGG